MSNFAIAQFPASHILKAVIAPGIRPLAPEYLFFGGRPLAPFPAAITGIRIQWGALTTLEDARTFLGMQYGDDDPFHGWYAELRVGLPGPGFASGKAAFRCSMGSLPSFNLNPQHLVVEPGAIPRPLRVPRGSAVELLCAGPIFQPVDHNFSVQVDVQIVNCE